MRKWRNKFFVAIDHLKEILIKEKLIKSVEKRELKLIAGKFNDYLIDAVLNGYPVRTRLNIGKQLDNREGILFQLVYEKNRNLTSDEYRIYRRSSILVDYIFKIEISGKAMHKEYTWFPSKKTMDKLQEVINSERIYQLVKQ